MQHPKLPVSSKLTLSGDPVDFPCGNPTTRFSNSGIISLCDTIFTEAGTRSSYILPTNVAKSATAASSKSMTLKYSFDNSRIIRNFAVLNLNILFIMRKQLVILILLLFQLITVSAQVILPTYTYQIVGKGNSGQYKCSGTIIEDTDIWSLIRISISDMLEAEFKISEKKANR